MSLAPCRHLFLPGCELDLARGRLIRGNGEVERLPTKEADLLGFLVDRVGRGADRETLYSEVWGYSSGVRSRALDTTVSRLRRRVGPALQIQARRGQGYGWLPPGADEGGLDQDVPVGGARVLTLVAEDSGRRREGAWGALVQAARRGAVRWVSLEPATEDADLWARLGAALGAVPPQEDPQATLRRCWEVLAREPEDIVLVLSEAERCREALQVFVRDWLGAVENLRLVVSSDRPLSVAGERVIRLDDSGVLLDWARNQEQAFTLSEAQAALPGLSNLEELVVSALSAGDLHGVTDSQGRRAFLTGPALEGAG